MEEIKLSVVIPAYNEEKRLPQTLSEIRPWLDRYTFNYEVLIADDGSQDKTAESVDEASKQWEQLRCLKLPHQGKGAAVRSGALEARGDNVLIMDADHPTPIDTLDIMLPYMRQYDAVVGVRTFSGHDNGASGRGRRIIGLIQQLMAHIIVFKTSVADSQCGFKLFSNQAAREIFSKSLVKGGMYDVEIFAIAHELNIKVYAKPVIWINKDGSTINIPRCMLLDPLSLFYISLMRLLGKYKKS